MMTFNFIEIWLVSLILLTGLVILIVTLQLNAALKKLVQFPIQPEEESLTWWQKFTGLKPIEEERNIIMEHTYDGIEELDNPTPPWFMYLFYLSIIFAVVYTLYYHVLSTESLQKGEYETEMAIAQKAREEYMKQFANSVNEDNVTVTNVAKDLTEGKTIYTTNCVACHGDKGQGGVGPNLTDKFWIHGGGIKDLFKTITHGIPEKGMIAWEKTLNPIQIQQVSSYVLTLQGTNPPGAKEPQGEEFKP